MKRLELVVVQFEEVKRLIEVGRVPQLRLAHILLDSAVELIMHRMAEAELDGKGRLLIRRSGTEPLIRVMAEGDDPVQVEAVVDRICAAVAAT